MLISTLLLVVGTVSVLSMFSVAITADNSIEKSTVALALAREKMESIKDANSWAAIDTFISPRANIGGNYPDFDRQVTVSGNPKLVDVIVYWHDKGVDQTVDLTTLFSNYNY